MAELVNYNPLGMSGSALANKKNETDKNPQYAISSVPYLQGTKG